MVSYPAPAEPTRGKPFRGLREPAWLWAGLIAIVVVANMQVGGITSYIAGNLGESMSAVLTASGSVSVVLIVALPIGGFCADRFGPRALLPVSLALLGAGAAVCIEAETIVLFAIGRALQGVAAGLCLPACLASVRPRRFGLSIGACMATFSMVAAFAGTGWLILALYATWRSAFMTMLGLDGAAVVLALFYRPVSPAQDTARVIAVFGDQGTSGDQARPEPKPAARPPRWTPVIAAAGHLLLLTIAAHSTDFATPPQSAFADQAALRSSMVLLAFVWAPLIGLLADRIEPAWVALVGSIALALCAGIALMHSEDETVYIVQTILKVLGFAGTIGLASRLLTVSGARFGLGVSLALLGFFASPVLAFAITFGAKGATSDAVVQAVPWVGVCFSVLSGILAAIILARKHGHRPS